MNKKNNIGRFILFLILFMIIIAMFHPSFLVFLPNQTKEIIDQFIHEHFSTTILSNLTPLAFAAATLTMIGAYLLSEICKFIIGKLHFKRHRSETIRTLIGNLLKYVIYIVAVIIALGCFGVDTTSMFVSAGVVGIVIGFGAQSLIEDVITGLFIVFEGEFEVGDIITIDGFRGEVKSIGLRTVSIIDNGGNIRIINNSEISSLINLSEVTSVAVVNVPISYLDPLEKAEAAVKEALTELPSEYPHIFKEAPVYKGVDVLAETHIELMVVAKVAEKNIYHARRIMQREIKLACEKAQLNIPCSEN